MAGAGLSLTSPDKNTHITIATQMMPIISLSLLELTLNATNKLFVNVDQAPPYDFGKGVDVIYSG